MTTLVGTQTDFTEALKSLLELDYDAIEAYNMAIERLEQVEYKQHLSAFRDDHQRHVKEISQLLAAHSAELPTGPDAKQWLAKGKVALGNLLGDKAILRAMLSNEEDTNTAYERVCRRKDIWTEALEIINRGWMDEKRHKAWIEQVIA